MAGQVVSTVLARAGRGRAGGLLTQFRHDGTRFVPHSTAVAVDERPPMVSVPEYRALLGDVVVG
jgi:glucosyl-3-phosphoglycerate synthase